MTPAERQAVLHLYGLERLEDAKRETWPWVAINPPHYPRPVNIGGYNWAWMPDFPNDDAAAVKLAERMGLCGIVSKLCPPNCPERSPSTWNVMTHHPSCKWHEGPTLGAALLAALTGETR